MTSIGDQISRQLKTLVRPYNELNCIKSATFLVSVFSGFIKIKTSHIPIVISFYTGSVYWQIRWRIWSSIYCMKCKTEIGLRFINL